MRYLVETYEATRADPAYRGRDAIKWDAELDRYLAQRVAKQFDPCRILEYFDPHFNGRAYQLSKIFRTDDPSPYIAFSDPHAQKPWMAIASDRVPDLHLVGAAAASTIAPRYRYTDGCKRVDNITDWALWQFREH